LIDEQNPGRPEESRFGSFFNLGKGRELGRVFGVRPFSCFSRIWSFSCHISFCNTPQSWWFGLRTQIQAKGEAVHAAMFAASPAALLVVLIIRLQLVPNP
jgi:hypothetical protein